MLFEISALLGAVGIVITVFAIINMPADNPLETLVAVLVFVYILFPIYIFILNRIGKRKEEKRATE
jgi:Mn2+/Fe2+ NRAMP family transporter